VEHKEDVHGLPGYLGDQAPAATLYFCGLCCCFAAIAVVGTVSGAIEEAHFHDVSWEEAVNMHALNILRGLKGCYCPACCSMRVEQK